MCIRDSYQAVSYIWERFSETYLSDEAKKFIEDWRPVKAALAHRPFDANSVAYQDFVRQTHERIQALEKLSLIHIFYKPISAHNESAFDVFVIG